MRDDRTDRDPPPAVPTDAFDAERMEFLERVAAWLQTKYRRRTPVIITGGTALAMAYHRARGTGDLDIDTTERLNVEEAINDLLRRSGEHQSFRVSTKQRGSGNTRIEKLNPDGTRRWATKVDQKVREGEHSAALHSEDCTRRAGPNGTILDTYTMRRLALIKIEKLKTRTEGRDLFDHAYVLATAPEVYTRSERREAVELLREAVEKNWDTWMDLLQTDRGTRSGNVEQILMQAWTVAMNDPSTVIDEIKNPQGRRHADWAPRRIRHRDPEHEHRCPCRDRQRAERCASRRILRELPPARRTNRVGTQPIPGCG